MDHPAFHAGIDLGTSQTKVCLQRLGQAPTEHEFLRFGGSFFLPSVVWVREDGTLAYGPQPGGKTRASYNYFKIASAEDLEFRCRSGLSRDGAAYLASSFEPFSPEALATLYLAHVLLLVREAVRERASPKRQRTGFLRGLRTPAAEPTLTVGLGYPTEYLSAANELRKRKFESILALADGISERYGSSARYADARAEDLRRDLAEHVAALPSGEGVRGVLDDRGLSVFPEAAAGLASLHHSGGLRPGHYASLDVGAGSTDLSFFRVNGDATTSYLASESVLTAANDIYSALARAKGWDASGAERWVRSRASDPAKRDDLLRDPEYQSVLRSVVKGRLYRQAVYRVFNGRVYQRFNRGVAGVNMARALFHDRPCYYYGGGSALPMRGEYSRIQVHDNGSPSISNSMTQAWTHIYREDLALHALSDTANVSPRGPELTNAMPLLAVAFGLSFPQAQATARWDDAEYTSYDLVETPHPINEGLYVYDVVQREWKA